MKTVAQDGAWASAAGGRRARSRSGVSPHGVTQAKAEATEVAGPARVDDFMLADQNLLARQLYRMGDDKAVVLVTYAAGDKQLHADAPALMALKAAYAGKGVDMLAVDSRIGDKRDPVIADAKAAGLDMPILFDYEQLVGEELGVTRAAEVIVIDPKTWTVAYRGPVDGAPRPRARRPGRRPEGRADRRARPQGAADRLPGARQGRDLRPDLLRQDHRPDHRGQVRHLPPAGRHRPVAAEQLRADQGLLADDPRGDPHPPDAALPGRRDRRPLPGRRPPDARPDEDPGPLDRGRRAARRGRRPAGEDQAFQAPEWPLGKPDVVLEHPGLQDPGHAASWTTSTRWCRRP